MAFKMEKCATGVTGDRQSAENDGQKPCTPLFQTCHASGGEGLFKIIAINGKSFCAMWKTNLNEVSEGHSNPYLQRELIPCPGNADVKTWQPRRYRQICQPKWPVSSAILTNPMGTNRKLLAEGWRGKWKTCSTLWKYVRIS